MTNIVLAHVYPISYTYFDLIENKEVRISLINPYISEELKDLTAIKQEYLDKKVFDSMVAEMLKKPYYQEEGYTTSSFQFKDIGVTYLGQVKWWLTWFAHASLSIFDTEREAFDDFQAFLREKEVYISYSSQEGHGYRGPDGYCAMGAEDYWRWELCSCEGCKKSGWTVIKH